MGKDEVLFCEGFVEQVLDSGVQVAFLVGVDNFLREPGQQRSGNVVKRQIQQKVIFGQENLFLVHGLSLGSGAYRGDSLRVAS